MSRKRYSSEDIIRKLRQAEVMLGQGRTVSEVCKELCITDATYYKWRKSYGGMEISQARKLKALEQENARLKRAVADLTLDNLILKDAAAGNF